MHPIHRSVLAACTAFMWSACGSVGAGVGYSTPVSGDTEDGGAFLFEARAASGGPIRLGAVMRTRLADAFDQIAFGPEVTAELAPGNVMFGVRAGVHLVQFDNVSDEWDFSLGSPYISPVLEIRTGSRAFVFFSGLVEYIVHLDEDIENQWFLGAQVGFGFRL